MLQFIESQDPSTIALAFNGNATKEDAEKLDQYVRENFNEDEKFNILAIMTDVDGTTFQGATEGVKFDIKRWKQFDKFAVVSDKDWIGTVSKLSNYLPGITVEYFEGHQLEEAWMWIKK
ncbi:STAS/SEC14 domain-containing protein [Bacillus sp. ISL-47]|uniref:STAS/SEC14 domain-containing protein n=1 Tax=Bacillus sp. ISL-47 TaxID=2819130 RepID=UPI001BEAEBA4|nr:STAS/SEC14 domain-containing protein [Bacillus sp. ISL-47]MBT2687394.1 STAS/SEC14 domain-containing protein [Bacillus sp. ISL-47]MBT2707144.1 STAS/SEC14 domain-containing protein [Pseudomonas sp. ISL-84]